MSSSTPNTKATSTLISSKPVDILQSQYSLLYANIHPVLILSLLLYNFQNLVRDPVDTLLGLAPTIAVLQSVYCVGCLPCTGQTIASPPKPGQKKKATKPAQDVWSKLVVQHILEQFCVFFEMLMI